MHSLKIYQNAMQMDYSEKKIIIFFWLAKYKVFDMCDFSAMPLKVTGALPSPLPAN